MKIVCANAGAAIQVSGALSRHGIAHQVNWQRSVAGSKTARIVVRTALDPAQEQAIRRAIAAVAGTSIEE